MSKGSLGYIDSRQKMWTAITLLSLAAVLCMYFGALYYFKTNQNVFTILAAVSCLFVGKSFVDMVMFYRAKGCSVKAGELIKMHLGKLQGAFDLYLTTYDVNYQLSHVVVSGKCVCAFTQSPKIDVKSGEKHIREMMENNGHKGYTVKIFQSLDQYLDRLDELNAAYTKSDKNVQEVISLLLSISL